MRLIKLVFKIVLILVVLIAIGGYLFIRNFDLNKYKPMIAELTEKQLGRKLVINGDAELGISFVPTLVVNDVELQNAEWASTPYMVQVEKLEIKVSVLPLLKRQVVIDNINIVSPVINLEIAKDGKTNWDFSKLDAPSNQQIDLLKDQAVATGLVNAQDADKTAEVLKENPQAIALAGFAARNISIENGALTLIDNKTGKVTQAVLNDFEMSAPSMDANISLVFDALFNDQKIKGEADVGSINKLLNNEPNYPIDAKVSAYGADVQLNGSVNGILSGDISFAAAVQLHNPQGNFGAPKVDLRSNANGNLNVVELLDLVVEVNGNQLQGKVTADISGKVPYVDAVLDSDKIDVRTLGAESKTAFMLPAIIPSAQASELVPNDKIPYEFLNMVDARALLNVKSLVINEGLTLQNVSLNAVLKNGVLNVNPLKANVGGGMVDVLANVNAQAKNIMLKVKGDGVVLQNVVPELKVVSDMTKFGVIDGGVVDVDINLNGKGLTYRDVVDSLNGQVIVIANQSTIQTGKLQILSGNFVTQLLQALKLDKNVDKNINMNCAVVRTDVKNGVFDFPKGIVFNGKKLNIVSSGTLNIANDQIDFTLHPYSGEVIDANVAQAIASFLKVKGTIQSPKIVLDDTQAIKAIVGVAATGGTAYLGSQLLMDNDSSPCYTALKGTPYAGRFPEPSAVNQAEQAVYQGASDVVQGSVDAVKDTAKLATDGVKDTVNEVKDAAKNLLGAFGVKKK